MKGKKAQTMGGWLVKPACLVRFAGLPVLSCLGEAFFLRHFLGTSLTKEGILGSSMAALNVGEERMEHVRPSGAED